MSGCTTLTIITGPQYPTLSGSDVISNRFRTTLLTTVAAAEICSQFVVERYIRAAVLLRLSNAVMLHRWIR